MPGQFNANDYVDVQTRIARFWSEFPDGALRTELASAPSEFTICRYRAEAYKHRDNPQPDATGYAFEIAGQGGANRTSHEENCETSALGRALANMGYASSSKDRPSREEVQKVTRADNAPVERSERPHATKLPGPVESPAHTTSVSTDDPSASDDKERERQNKRLHKLVADLGDDHSAVHVLMSLKGYASVKDAPASSLKAAADWVQKTHPNNVRTAIAKARIRLEQMEQAAIEPDVLAGVNAELDAKQLADHYRN